MVQRPALHLAPVSARPVYPRTAAYASSAAPSLREPTSMDAEAILHELTHAEGLPREALKAATAQRIEMLPLFLNEIESYLALGPAARAKPTPLFFIFHLLGEWREKVAYRPLARLLRLPGRDLDAIFGDGITTTSHRVMAAVFDGDPEPLYEIFLDRHAEQFVQQPSRAQFADFRHQT
jgi:Protein of unknown function (DUF1186)